MAQDGDDRWRELRLLRKPRSTPPLAPWEQMALLRRAAERRAARLLAETQAAPTDPSGRPPS